MQMVVTTIPQRAWRIARDAGMETADAEAILIRLEKTGAVSREPGTPLEGGGEYWVSAIGAEVSADLMA